MLQPEHARFPSAALELLGQREVLGHKDVVLTHVLVLELNSLVLFPHCKGAGLLVESSGLQSCKERAWSRVSWVSGFLVMIQGEGG